MKKLSKVEKKGFTLVEVMLVVAILVILTSLSFINVGDAINRARDRQDRESDKFVTQVQSQADYIRGSMLASTPRYSH